jgi:hypothetical protein
MVFLTKKQKAAMRVRRRKKKQSTLKLTDALSCTTARVEVEEEQKENPQDDQMAEKMVQQPLTSGKRKFDEVAEEVKPSTTSGEHAVVKIRLPADSTTSEMKKFRKDWRRKARRKYPGILEENIIFYEDSSSRAAEPMQVFCKREQEETDKIMSLNGRESQASKCNKKLKTFPRINDLLAQQKLATAAEKERQKQLEKEKEISEEEKKKYVAIDCEMVGVGMDGKTSALARVSIVNWDFETLLDTFVTVPERVTDFRTWVSGVRAKDIQFSSNKDQQNVMELNACRSLVGNLLKDKIVVGHALKNDFQALMLDHPKTHVRDTAKYRPFMRHVGKNGGKHRARKLRDLVEEKLGRKIQVKGESHNSVDDAIAAMELYKLERIKWEKEIASKLKKRT